MSNLLSVFSMPLSRSHQSPVSPWGKTLQVRSWLLPLQRTPLQSHGCFFRDRFHCSARKNQTGTFWGKVKETFALLCKPLAALRRVLKTRVKMER